MPNKKSTPSQLGFLSLKFFVFKKQWFFDVKNT